MNELSGRHPGIDGWPEAYPIEGDDLPQGPCTIRAGVHIEDDGLHLTLLDG